MNAIDLTTTGGATTVVDWTTIWPACPAGVCDAIASVLRHGHALGPRLGGARTVRELTYAWAFAGRAANAAGSPGLPAGMEGWGEPGVLPLMYRTPSGRIHVTADEALVVIRVEAGPARPREWSWRYAHDAGEPEPAGGFAAEDEPGREVVTLTLSRDGEGGYSGPYYGWHVAFSAAGRELAAEKVGRLWEVAELDEGLGYPLSGGLAPDAYLAECLRWLRLPPEDRPEDLPRQLRAAAGLDRPAVVPAEEEAPE